MMAGFLSVGIFLVSLAFSLILFVLWIRVILRYWRVSVLHPVSQPIHSLTNPVLGHVERLVYNPKSRLPRYDWVCLALIAVVEGIKFLMLGLLMYQITLPFEYLILFILADFIVQPCNMLFYALLIRVVLSWVNPYWQRHPVAELLILVTDPLIRLGQRIIPNISGFDFGPFIMMIILKIITLFFSNVLPMHLI